MSLILSYDAALSRVRAALTGLADLPTWSLQRSTDQIRWTTVRGAAVVLPVGGSITVDDYEFAADVANFYRLTGPVRFDDFERTSASGWATATSGQTWTNSGGTGTNHVVSNGLGRHIVQTVATIYSDLIPVGTTDMTVRATLTLDVGTITGASVTTRVGARAADDANYYAALINWTTTDDIVLALVKIVAGSTTVLAGPLTVQVGFGAGQQCTAVVEVSGSTQRAKAWVPSTQAEPDWQLTASDTAITAGTNAVAMGRFDTGNTNTLPAQVQWADFTVSTGASVFDGYGTNLLTNSFFETDASGWFVNSGEGSIARSTAQAHEGVASLLLTPDGVGSQAAARSVATAGITPGQTLTGRAWLRCAVARTVRLRVDWRDSGGTFLSSSNLDIAVAANTWTSFEVIATAPASTAQAGLTAAMTGAPAGSNLLYIDEAMLLSPGITPDLGGAVWLKSVPRPFLNRAVRVRGQSDFTRPSRSGRFAVVGRSLPIAVTDVRGSRQFVLQVYAADAAEARALDLMLASGDILFVHTPSTGRLSRVPGGYVDVADTSEVILDSADYDLGYFDLPCIQVAAPGPDVVGVTYLWQGVVNDYALWADVVAAFPTWADLVDNVGSAEDVIVQ